jgi:hypothetical protein
MAVANDADAQKRSFERLADGRVFVEIFGQQMALPGSEPELDEVRFYPDRVRRSDRPFFSLREALAEPDKARRSIDQEERSVIVRIIVDSRSGGPILGLYPRGTAPLGGVSVIVSRQIRPNFSRGKLPARAAVWPPESAVPDEDGYFIRRGVVSSNATEPMDIAYRLPAAKRLWRTGVDLIVICTLTGAPVRHCGYHLATEDGRISIGWSWHERGPQITPRMEPYTFPKSAWAELDVRLREVAGHLLLNRPSGEME